MLSAPVPVPDEINRFPAPSTVNPLMGHREAAVAGPPSPSKPRLPFPATMVAAPAGDIFITRGDVAVPTYMFPAESTVRPLTPPGAATPLTLPLITGETLPSTVIRLTDVVYGSAKYRFPALSA